MEISRESKVELIYDITESAIVNSFICLFDCSIIEAKSKIT